MLIGRLEAPSAERAAAAEEKGIDPAAPPRVDRQATGPVYRREFSEAEAMTAPGESAPTTYARSDKASRYSRDPSGRELLVRRPAKS
jgi:hypothetical protein